MSDEKTVTETKVPLVEKVPQAEDVVKLDENNMNVNSTQPNISPSGRSETDLPGVLNVSNVSKLSPELKRLYDVLYEKIEDIVSGESVSLTDANTLKIIIESAMEVVGSCRSKNGAAKRQCSLKLAHYAIDDLVEKGKLSPEVGAEIKSQLDFWGGMAMDIAVDAVKQTFNIGKKFAGSVREKGCWNACMGLC